MWHAYAQYTHDYCSMSLFAEMVLHVGQVLMLVIYKAENLSICHANNFPRTADIHI